MAIKEIVKYGAEVLTKKIELLNKKELDENLTKGIKDLKNTLSETKTGIGLAAPQIGLSLPVFITMDFEGMEKRESTDKLYKAYINPEIIEKSKECISSSEGCLSVPGIPLIHIYRPNKIKVKYLNEEYKEIEEELFAEFGCVFQHEYDHLQGKLIIDHLKKTKRKEIEKKLKKNNFNNEKSIINKKSTNLKMD